MTMASPVIGAALTNAELATYQDWILEKDRDLELQSFCNASVLDDDWTPGQSLEPRRDSLGT